MAPVSGKLSYLSRYTGSGASSKGDIDCDYASSSKRTSRKKKKKQKKEKKSKKKKKKSGKEETGVSTNASNLVVLDGADTTRAVEEAPVNDTVNSDSDSDSDESVERRRRHDSDSEADNGAGETTVRSRHDSNSESDSDSDVSVARRPRLTHSGDEGAASAAYTGKDAATVYRVQGKRVSAEELKAAAVLDEKEKARREYEWKTGAAQRQQRIEIAERLAAAEKETFARFADDEALNQRKKIEIHPDDPMAAYMMKKRAKNMAGNEGVVASGTSCSGKPLYSGPPGPPNRFGIKPGYRWDGVDRSNGHEAKVIAARNSANASKEERYKWSVQNM